MIGGGTAPLPPKPACMSDLGLSEGKVKVWEAYKGGRLQLQSSI